MDVSGVCGIRARGEGPYLIDVAEDSLLDAVVLHDLAEHTAVTAADDKYPLGVGVRVHSEVGDHLLVGELVALGGLDDVVEDHDAAVVGGLEDQDVLILALLVVEDLLDAEDHSLAWWTSVGVEAGGGLVVAYRATSPRSRGTIHLDVGWLAIVCKQTMR